MAARGQFGSFAEFYPYYLREHQNRTNRRLHFLGTSLAIVLLAAILATGSGLLLAVLPVAGYGPAWLGHFWFERNRPATFTYPLYSLIGDFRMYADMWTGRIPF
ncbi:MAG: DUF962 domain-containing protein [Gammaproteobacteria bacterium]|nr:DUF962 domain-containing protein [Gammaproteobacteria bacterium]